MANFYQGKWQLGKDFLSVFTVCVLFLAKGIQSDTSPVGPVSSNEILGNSGVPVSSASAISSSNNNVYDNSNNNYDQQQYRQYYPVAHENNKNAWNRDSYVNAAAESSNNYQPAHHGSSHSSSFFPSSDYGTHDTTGYDSDGLGFGGAGLGGLGGLGGLAGILGIKGVKGLGLLGLLKLAGIPLLLLVIPAILLLPLLLLFLPLPVITVPTDTSGRAIGAFSFADISGKMTHLARSVLESDKCVERISCEMSTYSRGTIIDRALKRVINRFETHMPNSLKRMARAYMEPTLCSKKYSCYLIDESNTKKST